MSHRHLEIDELDGVRALAPDDPRRREAEACPRCRALLSSFDEFLDDRSAPPGIDPAIAQRLDDAFERARGTGTMPRAASPVLRPVRARPRIWTIPVAWAAAAVFAMTIGVIIVRQRAIAPDVLRSVPDSSIVAKPAWQVFEPRIVGEGVELSWSRVPGADAYRVILLDADLVEIAALGPIADTTTIVTAAQRPAGTAAGAVIGWQVEALQSGHSFAASETRTLVLP